MAKPQKFSPRKNAQKGRETNHYEELQAQTPAQPEPEAMERASGKPRLTPLSEKFMASQPRNTRPTGKNYNFQAVLKNGTDPFREVARAIDQGQKPDPKHVKALTPEEKAELRHAKNQGYLGGHHVSIPEESMAKIRAFMQPSPKKKTSGHAPK